MCTTAGETAADYLNTTGTSYIFLGCILALVTYVSITRRYATDTKRRPALAETG